LIISNSKTEKGKLIASELVRGRLSVIKRFSKPLERLFVYVSKQMFFLC
jgi:hypothetical protein